MRRSPIFLSGAGGGGAGAAVAARGSRGRRTAQWRVLSGGKHPFPVLRYVAVRLLAGRPVNSAGLFPGRCHKASTGVEGWLLYDAYEVQRSLLAGASTLANIGAGWMQNPVNPFAYSHMGPIVGSALDVFAHVAAPRGKPEFAIETTIVGGKTVPVSEEIVLRKPFGQLKHFRREGVEGGPKLLVVAPMSGHYATLLRGTVERMLPFADVHITDWRDAKLAPLADGRFDLDDYIDYLVEFLDHI